MSLCRINYIITRREIKVNLKLTVCGYTIILTINFKLTAIVIFSLPLFAQYPLNVYLVNKQILCMSLLR